MFKFKRLLLISCFLIISIVVGCQKKYRENYFKDFYFNLEDFKVAKVYKYEDPINPEGTQYWELKSNLNTSSLITKTYNSGVKQIELFKEQFTSEGSKLQEYVPIEKGQRIHTIPKDLDVYKWNSVEPYKYSVTYQDIEYGKTIFTKTRHFVGEEKIKIMSKTYNALKFKGSYIFTFLDHNQKFEYYQYSYYTKELGFVRYDRYFPDEEKNQLILTKIYSEQEWNNLKGIKK